MNFEEWKRLIQHRESSQRAHAADQLPDSGERAAIVHLLLNCLEDSEPIVRACAADSLGQFSDQEVRHRLLVLLRTERDDLVRSHLVLSLAAMKNLDDLAVIANHIRQDIPKIVRVRAVCGLVELVDAICIDHLLRLCDDPDWKIRGLAFGALNAIWEAMQVRSKDIVKTAVEHRHDTEISALARPSIEKIIEESAYPKDQTV